MEQEKHLVKTENIKFPHEISLREYYAGLAMQGLLANSGGQIQSNNRSGWNFINCDEDDICSLSILLADCLLNKLKK